MAADGVPAPPVPFSELTFVEAKKQLQEAGPGKQLVDVRTPEVCRPFASAVVLTLHFGRTFRLPSSCSSSSWSYLHPCSLKRHATALQHACHCARCMHMCTIHYLARFGGGYQGTSISCFFAPRALTKPAVHNPRLWLAWRDARPRLSSSSHMPEFLTAHFLVLWVDLRSLLQATSRAPSMCHCLASRTLMRLTRCVCVSNFNTTHGWLHVAYLGIKFALPHHDIGCSPTPSATYMHRLYSKSCCCDPHTLYCVPCTATYNTHCIAVLLPACTAVLLLYMLLRCCR